jgi:hypothetical protein
MSMWSPCRTDDAFWASGRLSHPVQSFASESRDSYTDLGLRLPTPLSCERPSQLIVGHLVRRVDLVASLLVKLGILSH